MCNRSGRIRLRSSSWPHPAHSWLCATRLPPRSVDVVRCGLWRVARAACRHTTLVNDSHDVCLWCQRSRGLPAFSLTRASSRRCCRARRGALPLTRGRRSRSRCRCGIATAVGRSTWVDIVPATQFAAAAAGDELWQQVQQTHVQQQTRVQQQTHVQQHARAAARTCSSTHERSGSRAARTCRSGRCVSALHGALA